MCWGRRSLSLYALALGLLALAAQAAWSPNNFGSSFFLYGEQASCTTGLDNYAYVADGYCICNCYYYSDPAATSFNQTYPVYSTKPQCNGGADASMPPPVGQCTCSCQNFNYTSVAVGLSSGPAGGCQGDLCMDS